MPYAVCQHAARGVYFARAHDAGAVIDAAGLSPARDRLVVHTPRHAVRLLRG